MDAAAEYRAAVERETATREAVFLGLPEQVGGYLLRPFTPLDYTTLHLIGSPFITGGQATPADVWQFLWHQSVRFHPKSRVLRTWHRWTLYWHPDYQSLLVGCRHYVAEALSELPGGSGKQSKSYYSFLASVIDCLASEYGWTRDVIMRLPFKELCQYLKAIRRRKDPKAILFNASDPLFLRAVRESASRGN